MFDSPRTISLGSYSGANSMLAKSKCTCVCFYQCASLREFTVWCGGIRCCFCL